MTTLAPRAFDGWGRLAAALGVGIAGVHVTVLSPLLVDVISATGVPVARAGLVVSAEMSGTAIGSAAAAALMSGGRWRAMALTGAALTVAADLAGLVTDRFLAMRLVAGLGEGWVLAVGAAAMGAMRDPERVFATFVVLAFLVATGGFAVLPSLTEGGGPAALFAAFAALAGIGGVAALGLPRGGGSAAVPRTPATRVFRRSVVLGLAATLSYYLGVGAVWPFMKPIGLSLGLSGFAVDAVLTTTGIGALAGALLAVFLGQRLGRAGPLFVGLSAVFGSLTWLMLGAMPAFAVAPVLFLGAWNFTTPYLMGSLAALDESGVVIALNITLQYVGFGLGPMLANVVVTETTAMPVVWLGLMGSIGAMLLFWVAGRARAHVGFYPPRPA